jgi:hypothetical protein
MIAFQVKSSGHFHLRIERWKKGTNFRELFCEIENKKRNFLNLLREVSEKKICIKVTGFSYLYVCKKLQSA